MKFTKEQAVQEMTARVPQKDKDIDLTRTIAEIVENGLKAVGENEELELSAFCDLFEPMMTTAVGLALHEAKKAAQPLQAKIAEFEKKKTPAPAKKGDDSDDDDDPVAKLTATVNALQAELAEQKRTKSVSEKKSALAAKIAEKVKDKEWAEAILSKANITEETDVDAEVADYVELYNKTHATHTTSFTPKTPDGSGDGKPDLSALDNQLRQMRGDFGNDSSK